MTYDKLMEMCKAVGNQERMNVLVAVKDEPQNVNTILKSMDIKQSTLSHHLKVLYEAELIDRDIRGREIYYSLNIEAMNKLGYSLQNFNDNE